MTTPKTPAKPQYATSTTVDVDKTKLDIQRMLERYSATSFVIGFNQDMEVVTFEIESCRIRFSFLRFTDADLPRYIKRGARPDTLPTPAEKKTLLEQKQRTRWRELLLLIKAKLMAVDAGITTVEEEFLAHVVLANNQTTHEWLSPQLKRIYGSGQMPALLPGLESNKKSQNPSA